ncbi:leucine-rich repeat domain-containing protein [Flavobacterium poyangense]|uniref:leucine-rich repeat domain-containing protein n=1 Tax=Flavobacterium poyangense TaxID=2204302 RepID=UPI0014218474|nr:hypothetical protein [Flavobacterium sp. JXAS1]
MGIEEAKKKINTARSENSDTLILSSLELSSKDIKRLIPDIVKTNVTKLYLNRNPFQDLPKSVDQLKKLTFLSINGRDFETIPKSIGKLKNLKQLFLWGNLEAVAKSIGNLRNLNILEIEGYSLKSLPNSIGNLKNLKELEIKGNNLKSLPKTIGNLENLKKLEINGNNLKSLPETIGHLTNLNKLRIKGNSFTALPDSIFTLPNLTHLVISGNNLTTFPRSIDNLINLTELEIRGNNFTALPDSILMLPNLTYLGFSGNNFTAFPECKDKLKNLTELGVSGNRFTTLPQSIGNLNNLKELHLSHSAIRELPETLSRLRNLQTIDLTNCPLSYETMTWLNHTFSPGIVTYNMAAQSDNQSAKEIVKMLYTDSDEQKSVMDKIKNCDLDSVSVIYGGSQTQIKPAKEIINEFLSNVSIHSQHDLEFYGPPIKSTLDSILNEKRFIKEKRANNLAIMTTRMGDCPTPIREALMQEAVKHLLIGQESLSEINQTVIEREAIRDVTSKLKGYRPNEKIEQSYGLINSIYLSQAEENPKNPNLQIIGQRIRLPSITPYPEFAFQQIQSNSELIERFVAMVCQTNETNQPILDNGKYHLDHNKIKKIKDQYIAQFGFETGQQKEIKKHLDMYSQEITEFIKENKELATEYYQEAEHLLNTSTHKEQLKELLAKGNIKEMYEKFLSQKKSEILTFLNEKKNLKPQLDRFTAPINEKDHQRRPKSPDQSDKKQSKETHLTLRR